MYQCGLEVLMLVRAVVARGLAATDAGCRGCVINVPICSILGLNSEYVDVLMLVWAVSRSWTDDARAVAWFEQERLLSWAEVGQQLVLAAALSFHGICQEGVVRRLKVISEDFLRLALRRAIWLQDFRRLPLRRAVWMRKDSCGWSGWLCWVRGCDWFDCTYLAPAPAGGKNKYPTFGSLVCWWGSRPLSAGRGNRFHSPWLWEPSFVCHYFPPDRTWLKVNDPKVGL